MQALRRPVEALQKQLTEAAEVAVALVFHRVNSFFLVVMPTTVTNLHDEVVKRASVEQALQHGILEAGVAVVSEPLRLQVGALCQHAEREQVGLYIGDQVENIDSGVSGSELRLQFQ